MISVSEAFERITQHVPVAGKIRVPLVEAAGSILAEDVHAPIHMPPFDQSAMDGYALHLHDSQEYELVDEIKAGDHAQCLLKPGQAARIFTGGMVPEGANAVAKQEIVSRDGTHITIHEAVSPAENIRPKGEQITPGEIAMKKGTPLNPGTIGFLATLGITEISVYQPPRITLLATGNELVPPGTPLTPGKIYESNTLMLKSALSEQGLEATIRFVADDYNKTLEVLREILATSDLVLVTGGISVGDYDFVGKALNEIGAHTHFYKVKQKPGKPLYFGTHDQTVIFGIPGNPAAALTCFYVYVRHALNAMRGAGKGLFRVKAQLKSTLHKKAGLTHYLKASYDGETVEILPAQSSAMLSSFAIANCLVVADEEREEWITGTTVEAILLPQF